MMRRSAKRNRKQPRHDDSRSSAPLCAQTADRFFSRQHGLGNQAVQRLLRASTTEANCGLPNETIASTQGVAATGRVGHVPYLAEMERMFGEEFGGVKAHLGDENVTSLLGAAAIARRENIHFAETAPNRELVAHELAHVVQQRRGNNGASEAKAISTPGDSAETEAAAAARRVADGQAASELTAVVPGTVFGSWGLPWPSLKRPAVHLVTENVVTPEWLAAQGYSLRGRPDFWPQHWVHSETADEVWVLHQAKSEEEAMPKEPVPPEVLPDDITSDYCDLLLNWQAEVTAEAGEVRNLAGTPEYDDAWFKLDDFHGAMAQLIDTAWNRLQLQRDVDPNKISMSAKCIKQIQDWYLTEGLDLMRGMPIPSVPHPSVRGKR